MTTALQSPAMHPWGTPRSGHSVFNESHWHAHDCGQFILVESGFSHLRTERGAWIIPARRIGWVPPAVRHMSRSSARGKGWVLLPPSDLQCFPAQACVLRASPLMTASLQRLTRLPLNDGGLSRLLWRVVAAEMRMAQAEHVEVPMPAAPRLLKAAQSVLSQPTSTASLDTVAARAGMSRRSFARHFRLQTGLSYSRWKRAVIAHHAFELVAQGHKVSSVALDVGYGSVSAFIAMFRRQYGESPRRFLTENAERHLSQAAAAS